MLRVAKHRREGQGAGPLDARARWCGRAARWQAQRVVGGLGLEAAAAMAEQSRAARSPAFSARLKSDGVLSLATVVLAA